MANRSSNTISQFSRNVSTGLLTPLSPGIIFTSNRPADIIISPDGLSLFAVGESSTTIDHYSVNPSTGLLTAFTPSNFTTGSIVFDIAVSPDNKFVYASNFSLGSISQFSRTVEIRGTTISIVPYSAKVYETRNHIITGNVPVSIVASSSHVIHHVTNHAVIGNIPISLTSSATLLYRSHSHVKTGAVTISVVPTADLYKGFRLGAEADIIFPMPTLSATAHSNLLNSLTAGFITTTLEALTGANATCGFVDTTLSATGTMTETMSLNAMLFTSTLSATGTTDERATVSLGFISSTLTALGGANAALTAPEFGFSATATADNNRGNLAAAFVTLSLSATAIHEETMSMSCGFIDTYLSYCAINASAPVFTLSATGSATVANSVAYVMNVHTGESWEYSNYSFMHIINIGGKPYGVKSDGLYLLEGATDNGTVINGSITTKESDFGTFKSKRMFPLYLNSDTTTITTATVDSIVSTAKHTSSFGGRKTRIAKGLQGRYWQFTIENIKKLEGLEINPQTLSRSVN